jgi:hypothetical protein
MNQSFARQWVLCQVVLGLCVSACGADASREVHQSAQALAADPVPPSPQEMAARTKIAKDLDKQAAEDKRAYHKANAAALREALAVKRAILRSVEMQRQSAATDNDQKALDTELTSLRASISKTETNITSSDTQAQ